MTFRFGPAGQPAGSRDAVHALELVSSLGLDAMEVQFVRGVRMGESKAEELSRVSAREGIRLSAHAPYYVNFHSASDATRERSIGWVMDGVRACHHLKASPLVVHAASYGKDAEGCTASVRTGVSKCLDMMDDEGIRDVRIGLETMGKKASWGTLDEISDVVGLSDRLMPVLDLAHVHARDGGCIRSAGDVTVLLDRCAGMSSAPIHMHVSGIEFGERGERKHLPLDSAQPDMSFLAAALRGRREDVTMIVESPLQEKDAVWLKNLVASW